MTDWDNERQSVYSTYDADGNSISGNSQGRSDSSSIYRDLSPVAQFESPHEMSGEEHHGQSDSQTHDEDESVEELGNVQGSYEESQPLDRSIISQHPRYTILTVTEPQKVSDGSSAHISYLVSSQDTHDDRPEKVRRRFNEFVLLHNALAQEYPSCVIPPIPDKSRLEYIAGDRFSPEFTNKRAVALERFLFRVSQHDELRKSRAFNQFLNPSSGSKSTVVSKDSIVEAPRHSQSLPTSTFDHISDSLMNAFAKARHQSKEMIYARERAERYEHNIGTIDKAVQRVSKTQSDLVPDLESMSKYASKLAKIDPENAEEFNTLSLACHVLAETNGSLRRDVDYNFGGSLRDMAHYVQALKSMLKHREQRQIDYEVLVEYLKRAEHELVGVEHGSEPSGFSSSFLKSKINELRGVDKQQTRQARITKLKARIDEFKNESTYAKQLSDQLEILARREVRIFEQTEAIELQQTLGGLADSYISYYSDILQKFSELEASLE
ncbi:Snx4 protein [Starmerella bacillaris]|uniref:Sorting nexin-4 n=1 Tax=Starmerella bacillaris TaxID=1247836 RepID=A0AAV5RFR3_STABA|nr:Snx4 protein [Starmerella bacillaris]